METSTQDETARILAFYGSPRARFEYAQHEAERICREARAAAYAQYQRDRDQRAYDRVVIATGRERRAAILAAYAAYQAETGQNGDN